MPEKQKNYLLNKRVGAMVFTTGMLARVMTLQVFAERGFEITPEQYLILSMIMDSEGLYQRQLSEITYKDRPNISRIVTILENMGLVKRVKDCNKRMIFKLIVTESGIEMRHKIKPTMLEIRSMITAGIENEELEKCLSILEQMQDNMKDKVVLQI